MCCCIGKLLLLVAVSLEVCSAGIIGTSDANAVTEETYNEWVDRLLSRFTTNTRHQSNEGASIFLEVGRAVVDRLQAPETDAALLKGFETQCDLWVADISTGATDVAFEKILMSKSSCLAGLDASLELIAVATREDLSVRDHVTAQLLCRVLPLVLTCYEAPLSHLVGCTGNGWGVHQAMTQLHHIIGHYCANDSQPLIDQLSSAPSDCLSEGIPFFLKFLGPSFIENMQSVYPERYPCMYSKYVSSVADIILRKYCDAGVLVERLLEVEGQFRGTVGCSAVAMMGAL